MLLIAPYIWLCKLRWNRIQYINIEITLQMILTLQITARRWRKITTVTNRARNWKIITLPP